MTNLTDYRANQIADEAYKRLAQPELKHCPFCGGKAFINKGYILYWVSCQECGIEGSARKSNDEAIQAWNTRAHKPFNLENGVSFCCECGWCIGRHDDHFDTCSNCGAKVVD